MADVEKEVVGHDENFTENVSNTTARIPATTEGMAVAYGSLIIMALLPIFFGAFRSVKHHKEQQVTYT
jgi:minor histocompatibility antigen H13